MSKKVIGLIMVICGVAAFHLLGSQPETAPIWTSFVSNKIYSDPLLVANRYIFLGGDKGKKIYKLYEVDSLGKVSAESVKLPVLPYAPLPFADTVVVVDRNSMIRGFSVPGLKLAWESGTEQPIMIEPIKTDKDSFLVPSGKNILFCLNSKTGQPLWDHQFNKTLVNYGADGIVACITGFTDLKEPSWVLTGHSIDDGELLWTFGEPVSSEKPIFIQGLCLTTTSTGKLLVINQNTGELVYKHPADGLKAIQILDDRLILLAAGGSRVVCLSLMTGESWTTTMNSGFTGAAKFGNRILFANKKHVRCVNASNGSLFWSRNLGDIYNAFPFREGIFITHKDSFFDRSTYGSYLGTKSGTPIWTAYGKSIFQKPLITGKGDLVIAYNGTMKMLPSPLSSGSPEPSPTNLPIETGSFQKQQIDFLKSNIASSSEKVIPEKTEKKINEKNEGKKNNQTDKDKALASDLNIKDTGWVTDEL